MAFPTWVEMHGALTHFPIAMLLTAVFYEIGAAALRKPEWRIVSFWLLVTAVVLSVPSLLTGWFAGYDFTGGAARPPSVFIWHRLSAFITSGLSLLLLLWRVKVRDQLSERALLAYMVSISLAAAVVTYTGYLGGQMVFGGTSTSGAVTANSNPPAGATPTSGQATHLGQGTTPQDGAAAGPSRTATGVNVDPQLVTTGEKLFRSEDNNCLGCHKIGKDGGTRGPDLTHEAQRNSDLNWQIGHLKDPQKMKPGSNMPGYGDMKPEELKALAAYMITRK
ncbi:MAG: c-type cytochrome [Abitibacteriaceae bacterium]|nr:c-type cytochrome [Abditibacteriaceae bacterium]